MINEVIDEILKAETEAARIVAEANERAKEIGLSSHAAADFAKAEKEKEIREAVKVVLNQAEAEAETDAEAVFKRAEEKAEEITKTGEKNMTRVAEMVFDAIMRLNK